MSGENNEQPAKDSNTAAEENGNATCNTINEGVENSTPKPTKFVINSYATTKTTIKSTTTTIVGQLSFTSVVINYV